MGEGDENIEIISNYQYLIPNFKTTIFYIEKIVVLLYIETHGGFA